MNCGCPDCPGCEGCVDPAYLDCPGTCADAEPGGYCPVHWARYVRFMMDVTWNHKPVDVLAGLRALLMRLLLADLGHTYDALQSTLEEAFHYRDALFAALLVELGQELVLGSGSGAVGVVEDELLEALDDVSGRG